MGRRNNRHHNVRTVEPGRPSTPLLSLGRAIFGGFFIYSGIKHFRDMDNYAAYAESKHVPMARVAVAATGAVLVAGGVSLVTGVKPKLGAALIEGFLLTVSPSMHAFWKTEGDARQSEQVNFTKNLALAGAGLLAAAIPEPWPASLSRAGA